MLIVYIMCDLIWLLSQLGLLCKRFNILHFYGETFVDTWSCSCTCLCFYSLFPAIISATPLRLWVSSSEVKGERNAMACKGVRYSCVLLTWWMNCKQYGCDSQGCTNFWPCSTGEFGLVFYKRNRDENAHDCLMHCFSHHHCVAVVCPTTNQSLVTLSSRFTSVQHLQIKLSFEVQTKYDI